MFYLYLVALAVCGFVPAAAGTELGLPLYASVLVGVVAAAGVWLMSLTFSPLVCGVVTGVLFAASSFAIHSSENQIAYTLLHGVIGFGLGHVSARNAKGQP